MQEPERKEYIVEYYYLEDELDQLRFGYLNVSAKNMAEAAKKTYRKFHEVDIKTIVLRKY